MSILSKLFGRDTNFPLLCYQVASHAQKPSLCFEKFYYLNKPLREIGQALREF